jgi:hypothetical protein
MRKFIMYVRMDQHRDSIEIATADVGRKRKVGAF